jgi:hypothetical protein
VRLAARGQRDMDTAPEAIADRAELAQVRAQARAVWLKSLLAAAVLTVIAVLA